jgi:hypothetical protein
MCVEQPSPRGSGIMEGTVGSGPIASQTLMADKLDAEYPGGPARVSALEAEVAFEPRGGSSRRSNAADSQVVAARLGS